MPPDRRRRNRVVSLIPPTALEDLPFELGAYSQGDGLSQVALGDHKIAEGKMRVRYLAKGGALFFSFLGAIDNVPRSSERCNNCEGLLVDSHALRKDWEQLGEDMQRAMRLVL